MATVLASDAEAFRAEVRAWLDENLVGEYKRSADRNDLGAPTRWRCARPWEQRAGQGRMGRVVVAESSTAVGPRR